MGYNSKARPKKCAPEGEQKREEEKEGGVIKEDSRKSSIMRSCLHSQLRKTKFCTFHLQGACAHGDACTFAHTASEMQGAPDLRKTRMCKSFAAGRPCTDPKCSFAHSEEELRSTDTFYKKTLCAWFANGRCRNGAGCRFAHGPAELRSESGRPEPQVAPPTRLSAKADSRPVGADNQNFCAPNPRAGAQPTHGQAARSRIVEVPGEGGGPDECGVPTRGGARAYGGNHAAPPHAPAEWDAGSWWARDRGSWREQEADGWGSLQDGVGPMFLDAPPPASDQRRLRAQLDHDARETARRRLHAQLAALDAGAKPCEPAGHVQDPCDLEQQLENLRLASKALQCLGGLGGVEGLRARGLEGLAGLEDLAEVAGGDGHWTRRRLEGHAAMESGDGLRTMGSGHRAPDWGNGEWELGPSPRRVECQPQGGFAEVLGVDPSQAGSMGGHDLSRHLAKLSQHIAQLSDQLGRFEAHVVRQRQPPQAPVPPHAAYPELAVLEEYPEWRGRAPPMTRAPGAAGNGHPGGFVGGAPPRGGPPRRNFGAFD